MIGRAAATELARAGARCLALDRRAAPGVRIAELGDAEVWQRELAAFGRVDAILLLAGVVGVTRVLEDPERVRAGNAAPVEALIAALRATPVGERPRVFFASSSEVYLPARRPLREDDPVREPTEGGRWAYAAAKVAAERRLATALEWPRGREPVLLRFFNVVGPGQESGQGMVLPTFVERARAGLPIRVHGDGRQVRTLAHVDEVARVLRELLAHRDLPGGPLNVGGAARASVLDLAQLVAALAPVASPVKIEHVDPRVAVHKGFEDVAWREPDLTRLRALGIDPPARDLESIVRDVWRRHPSGEPGCASPAS